VKLSENAKAERERIRSRFRELIGSGVSRMDAYRKLGKEFGKSERMIMIIIND
jgi:hypothetical protein